MKKIIYVQTGEVKASRERAILQSNAIGSCLVVVAYDCSNSVGALAHVMLPGKAPEKKGYQKTRYAVDAIDHLIKEMKGLGAKNKNLEFCLVGGANVLKKENDSIAGENRKSVIEVLNNKNFRIAAKSIGGFERRTVSLDITNGTVDFTKGDSQEEHLHTFTKIND